MFGKFVSGIAKTIGTWKEPLKRIGQVGYKVGRFAVQNHSTLVPLIHGVSMLSGNQKAQQITGGLLALSKTATMRQNLNADNQKVASAMGRGGYGVFDHSTNRFK